MGKFHSYFFLGLLLPCLLSASLVISTTNITTDQSALLAVRAQFSIESRDHVLAKNWSVSSSVCGWIGVTCGFRRHRRVTALNISNMGLDGLIPPQLGNLSFLVSLDMTTNGFYGELPQELARLRRLRVLRLGGNHLDGYLPPWLGSFHQLQYLTLMNNSFTGLIPPSISNMSRLVHLNLAFNDLRGHIKEEIFNISSLEIISLISNSFTGSLPDYMCQNLQGLNWLSLSTNKLSGQIPSSIGRCSRLQMLSLSDNEFYGVIPKEIGNMKMLEKLYLGANSLQGEIPKEVGNLTRLVELDFFDSNLSGEIPEEIGNLNRLMSLDLSSNNITGLIPREISNLSNLEKLSLRNNTLTGSIPIEISNISTIRVIDLAENQLSGNLPSTIGYGLRNLEEIYVSKNNFLGAIPDMISNSSKLHVMEFSSNRFTGYIPNFLGDLRLLEILNLQDNLLTSDSSSPQLSFITSLTNCKHLRALVVSENPLYGVLPDSVGNLSTSLKILFASSCEIRGSIPSGIGNLSSLINLGLFRNQLTGSLPITIMDLQKLQGIDLTMNKLSNMALDLFCVLPNLGTLYLVQNQIIGSLPECLGNVTSLRHLDLGYNRLNSSVPTNIWNLKDLLELNLSSNSFSGSLPAEIRNLKMATLVDLSMNNISGGIPSSIGDMENLITLSLANNRFEGSIPESTSEMLSLQSLDLSHNFLSGSIPMSMEKLRYLTDFNVSFNNLSGEIPSRGPFTNFTEKSFISNGALCGTYRFHVPRCSSISSHRLGTKKVHQTIFIVLGVIILVTAMFFGFVYLRYRRKHKFPNGADLSLVVTQERISYYKLLQATDNYNESNLLGTGSFGFVYKGTLDDGKVVAIKVFNLQFERAFKSFDVECEVLRKLRHRNLTKVISSCSNSDFKALVLEFMPNGSLEKWLYLDNYFLDIEQRLDILIDVACALQYLHFEYSTPVVHCDLKPSNVLLDESMTAHVSDFGIAKLLGQEDSITFTKTLATLGYLAPEYGSEGLVSTKCDVYSFGIMTMELFTRTSPNNERFGESMCLKSWVYDSMSNGLTHIIDANLLNASDEYFPEMLECILSIMKVALNCTNDSRKERSNIQDVLVALKKIKLQLLPYTKGS
ncbi:hypothetical protein ACH5RR_001830 [Cinchona calisaya]|uniref:non-specific serine/threonine protein kinase n=1 Tax=Cinchona calisaya TaxID=153742 RepID=A0ABD3B4S7_9GENT